MTGTGNQARSVFIWVCEGTWRATVDAALDLAPAGARFTLLHVTPPDVPDAVHGAYAGLLGRAGRDPGSRLEEMAATSAGELLEAAAARLRQGLGRPGERLEIAGRAERAVVAASARADLLIVARDGDRARLGPKSLGKAHGHTIVAVAADSKPGPTPMEERPNLKPWVTDPAHMATYDGIVAAKQDRLSRADWSDEARIRLWAEKHGKTLFIVDHNLQWPPIDADGRERWNYGAEQARREWEETSKRYRRMQKSLREQGYLVGRAHYGHRTEGVKCGESPCKCKSDRKIPVLDPDTAPIVREMAERYISGQSSRVIRDWLNATGVAVALKSKRGKSKGWREHKVLEILHNPVIIGHYQHEGVTYLYAEPIISVEDFNTIQEMTAARRKTPGIVRKETALLTSMIKCDRGNSMYRVKTEPRRRCPDGIWYYCDEKLCLKGSRLLVPLAEMDSTVDEAVSSMTDIEHIVTTIIPGDTYGEEIKQLKKEQARLDPNENPEHFKRWLAIRDEILELRSKPRKAPTITTKSDGKSVAEVWDSLSPAGKRQWLLARRPSGWLPGESTDHSGAKVQVFGRDPETDLLVVDIDLGEFTEAMASLQSITARDDQS